MSSNGIEQKSATMGLFGLIVIGSGLWRFFSAEGGHAGLWFGMVMGGLALISASLFYVRTSKPAMILGGLSIALVGGWFGYESFIKKGFANSETRQLIVIAVTIATAASMIYLMSRSVVKQDSN